MEFNLNARPAFEFEDERSVASRQNSQNNGVQESDQAEEREGNVSKLFVSKLKIKLPALGEIQTEEDDGNDGFKTPTSLDYKIPVILPCPPAPKKLNSRPSAKRKWSRRRVLLDLSNEIDSLFPPAVVLDLGARIKKVKQQNDSK